MIIFTTSNWKEKISKLRMDRLTKIITMDLADMFVAKLFNESFWEHQLEMDPERKVHKSYYLHQVWNEKSNFLKQALDINPFRSSTFVWIDIGAFRNTQFNNVTLMKCPPSIPDKMEFLDVTTLHKKTRDRMLGGGLFGGRSDAIIKWHHYFYIILKQMGNENRFVGKDQIVMAATCANYPFLCKIFTPVTGSKRSLIGAWFSMKYYWHLQCKK